MDDATRCRTDVGPAKSAQFGFVTDSTQAHPHETASQRFGDGLAEAGFAHTRRADEGQDGLAAAFTVCDGLHTAAAAYGEIFENAVFDFCEAIVIAIKDGSGMCHVNGFAA